MTYSIALVYDGCGCTDTWEVEQPAQDGDETHHTPEVCLPEYCCSCKAAGRPCPPREALARFKPATFTEIAPVRRLTRRKASA